MLRGDREKNKMYEPREGGNAMRMYAFAHVPVNYL